MLVSDAATCKGIGKKLQRLNRPLNYTIIYFKVILQQLWNVCEVSLGTCLHYMYLEATMCYQALHGPCCWSHHYHESWPTEHSSKMEKSGFSFSYCTILLKSTQPKLSWNSWHWVLECTSDKSCSVDSSVPICGSVFIYAVRLKLTLNHWTARQLAVQLVPLFGKSM